MLPGASPIGTGLPSGSNPGALGAWLVSMARRTSLSLCATGPSQPHHPPQDAEDLTAPPHRTTSPRHGAVCSRAALRRHAPHQIVPFRPHTPRSRRSSAPVQAASSRPGASFAVQCMWMGTLFPLWALLRLRVPLELLSLSLSLSLSNFWLASTTSLALLQLNPTTHQKPSVRPFQTASRMGTPFPLSALPATGGRAVSATRPRATAGPAVVRLFPAP